MSLCFLTRHPIITTRTTLPPYCSLPLNSIISSSGEKPAQSLPTRRSTSSSHAPPMLIIPTSKTKQPQRRAVSSSIPVMVCDALDQAINKYMEPPLSPSMDPNHVLAGNFSPLDELPPTDCPDIDGEVPACLDGAYIRNGPNPQHYPRGPHHLFDGDGMLHCLRISRGRASLCSRYVRTYKYNLEHEAGSPLVPNFFSGIRGVAGIARAAVSITRALTGQVDPRNGFGLANTSLAFFGGRLFALGESDLPYAIHLSPDDGDITTIGRCDFDKTLSFGMTAHPKTDPDTGETFAFRYTFVRPFLTYFMFDADGTKLPDVPITSLTRPLFLHDFAITKKYALFFDIQMGVRPMNMILKGGHPIGSDPAKVTRIGVLPRYATDDSQMRWFEVPGFNIVHSINAWDDDEEGAIILIAPNVWPIEHMLASMDLIHCSVEKVRIDLKSGTVSRTQLSDQNLDMGVVNPAFLTKKNRYAYMGLGEPMPKMSGVVKLDLELGKTVATRLYGPGCYGGEPQFVPDVNNNEDEDEGYVVSYVHDEVKGESRLLVMDSKSSNLDVVASVKLPRRVPYGFHGLFISEDDLYKRQHPLSISSSSRILF
ncbi:hypothetical protein QJS10_CPA10g01246 [Acorus calamus]|uniref:Carotenoid cleavage dioxygenase 4 n=1 Tax=Acorus calamus TaxID=4465 RepID=A0AAV9DXP8_ACOCL|nr:hypothetical protein QJS10_CPA10g01246 [Acorus calamus]